tara:strand:+ start:6470 stop:6607 length:138 start_codon:yes stop_codon:yes gene_type:complete
LHAKLKNEKLQILIINNYSTFNEIKSLDKSIKIISKIKIKKKIII